MLVWWEDTTAAQLLFLLRGPAGSARADMCPPDTQLPAGPCIGLDTACSSSLVATHLAHRGLLDGETSAALASGINLMLVASTSTHLAQLGALSPDGRSKSFDAAANGYGRGEACVSAVLRLPREQPEGPPALAVMLGALRAAFMSLVPALRLSHCLQRSGPGPLDTEVQAMLPAA